MNFLHFIFKKTFDLHRMLHLLFPIFNYFLMGFATHFIIEANNFLKHFIIYLNPKLFIFYLRVLFIYYYG